MGVPITTSYGSSAYVAVNRLVSPLVPTTTPAPQTLAGSGGTRFEPAGIPPLLAVPPPGTLPSAPPTAPDTALPNPPADVGALSNRLSALATPPAPPPPPPQVAPDAFGAAPSGPPSIAVATQATALYAQTQQLTGALPPAQLPSGDSSAGPGFVGGTMPTDTGTPQGGTLGVSALGGAAASPTSLLSFTRGSLLNVFV